MLLKKSYLIYIMLFVMMVPFISGEDFTVGELRTNVRKALLDYLSNPETAKMTEAEIIDIVAEYVSVPASMEDNQVAPINAEKIPIVQKAASIDIDMSNYKCDDGTLDGRCSVYKPRYCSFGRIYDNCYRCGCPVGFDCEGGSCINTSQNSVHSECQNYICVTIQGPGSNECTYDSQCQEERVWCNDTDGGINENVFGITYDSTNVNYSDACTNYSQSVREYYCFNGSIDYQNIICVDGECINGACEYDWCNDSDGQNYLTKGIVYHEGPYGNYSNEDSCPSWTTKLAESVCYQNGSTGVVYYNCSDLGSGYACQDGACVNTEQVNLFCNETDNGMDYYTKGNTFYYNSTSFLNNYTDLCWYDKDRLSESYCPSSFNSSQDYENEGVYTLVYCSDLGNYICEDGACVQQDYCNDTDNGQDYFTKGTVTNSSGSSSSELVDSCYGNSLTEHYCINSSVSWASETYKDCTSLGNYICEDGACVQQDWCNDTDGLDYYHKGSLIVYNSTYGQSVADDFCDNLGNLHERKCIGTMSSEQWPSINCSTLGNYICEDGACVQQSTLICTDYDGGKDYYQRGNVTLTNNSLHIHDALDSCNGNILTEYFCNSTYGSNLNYIDSEWVNCTYLFGGEESNGICIGGKCYNGSLAYVWVNPTVITNPPPQGIQVEIGVDPAESGTSKYFSVRKPNGDYKMSVPVNCTGTNICYNWGVGYINVTDTWEKGTYLLGIYDNLAEGNIEKTFTIE